MTKRPVTPAYIIFFILFLPDSWRILIGIAAAALFDHFVTGPDMDAVGRIMIFLMLAAIGYAASGYPARWISYALKRLILKDMEK